MREEDLPPFPDNLTSPGLVDMLRRTTAGLVRREGPDLTIRQLSVLLICYLDTKTDHTVRGLAEMLDVAKPAISRALDRLADLHLVRRMTDPSDRRSVVVRQTGEGLSFFRDLSALVKRSTREALGEGAPSAIARKTGTPARETA